MILEVARERAVIVAVAAASAVVRSCVQGLKGARRVCGSARLRPLLIPSPPVRPQCCSQPGAALDIMWSSVDDVWGGMKEQGLLSELEAVD
jgi:hypothetical protein